MDESNKAMQQLAKNGSFNKVWKLLDPALNNRPEALPWTVQGGGDQHAVVISVHQIGALQLETSKLLRNLRKTGLPAIVLASNFFSAIYKSYVNQADLVFFSLSGEINHKINADTIHFVGGDYNACMAGAVAKAIHSSLSFRGRPFVRLIFHTSLIYGSIGTETPGTLKDKIMALNDAQMDDLREWLEAILFKEQKPKYFRGALRRLNPASPAIAEFGVTRFDGKKVFLEFR